MGAQGGDEPAPEPETNPQLSDELVGRADQLAVLQSAFDAAASGRPTAVLLLGEPGIGKTRLADESAVLARRAGMRVLRGEADAAVRQPMELWRGVHRSLGVAPAVDPVLPAEERRWDHLESLAGALGAAAPAAVVLDDLHWADALALWVLERLPRALGDAAVALVMTSREREPGMARLDGLRRVARVVTLDGLDTEAVGRLAMAHTARPIDAAGLHARTGGNPLFVQELLRGPDGGGVIGDVLDRTLARFDAETRALLAAAAVAGPSTPLAVLAVSTSIAPAAVAEHLAHAQRERVLDEVAASGVRFRHALLAEAAERLADAPMLHAALAAAWEQIGGADARAEAASHRLHAATDATVAAEAVGRARQLAAELTQAGQQARAVGLLRDARDVAAAACSDVVDLRARVALDLARALRWLGDLEIALELHHEASELAELSTDPVLRAKAAVGAYLWVNAFVPDPPRLRRLEAALAELPADEVRLRAEVLGRLAVVASADVDTIARGRAWGDEAIEVARRLDDPVLLAQALLNRTMAPGSRDELDARIVSTDAVVALSDRAGRADLALHGHQRRFCHSLNHGDIGTATQALERAELLARLLPSPGWRQRTLVRRTTLLAMTGNRSAAVASMEEAARAGAGHIEPLLLVGCELLHRCMLVELYGGTDQRAVELYEIVLPMLDDVPSTLLQVQKAFVAQLLGDEARVQDVLQRYAVRPERVEQSMSGDQLLRMLGETVARAGATPFAGPVYDALLPYAGLFNVGGGESGGLPVDDVLGRLAVLTGDVSAAVVHARAAVAMARALPSPPMLVHCLDHLGDVLARAGGAAAEVGVLQAEAALVAAEAGVERLGRERPSAPHEPAGRVASLRRQGALWSLSSPLGHARLADSAGLGQLARLLQAPGIEVAAVDLAGPGSRPVASDLGPALDAQAKRAYRQRLLELQAEVDDAEVNNDPVRGERAHVEIDALLRELRRAVGLSGRDRPTGSEAERARVNVVRSLRRAIAAIEQQAPELGAHLDVSVRTGRWCAYRPEPAAALSWTVEQ